jgi:hypothetical protein
MTSAAGDRNRVAEDIIEVIVVRRGGTLCRIFDGRTGRHVSSPSLIPRREIGGSESRLVAMKTYETFSRAIAAKKTANNILVNIIHLHSSDSQIYRA